MLLGVNIDHVATLRNARGGVEPNIIKAAEISEQNGATSITTHLREDRRHIKDEDVRTLITTIKTKLNLEMAMADDIQKIALEIKPHSICLVPEKRQEITTEGGLDVAGQREKVKTFIKPLLDAGIIVSLFIDPTEEQVIASSKTGAQFIEMHSAAILAQKLGLKVNAGHGLNYKNVHRMHEIPDLYELNIGHSIISKAVFTGLADAVKEMANLIK